MTTATSDLSLTILWPLKNCIEGILPYTHSGQYYHAVASMESVMSFYAPESKRLENKQTNKKQTNTQTPPQTNKQIKPSRAKLKHLLLFFLMNSCM